MRVGGCEYGMVLRVSRLRLIICLVFAVCLVAGGWWLVAGGWWCLARILILLIICILLHYPDPVIITPNTNTTTNTRIDSLARQYSQGYGI